MKQSTEKARLGVVESILLMSLLISLTALSIDTMLPALPAMGRELAVAHANDIQLIISSLILGLSFGQLVFGPVSDSLGRRPVLLAGGIIYLAGTALCILSGSFPVMLAGRVLQGIGAAGPRTIVAAIIRDQYEGRDMARMMSVIMSVFIVIPAIAPTLGQGILMVAPWRAVFGALFSLAMIALIWFAVRQPETLSPTHWRPFSFARIARAFAEVAGNRLALGYTLVAGCLLGAFFGYLNSAQQVFQEVYGLGKLFPLFFAILALAIGGASFFNSRIVVRFGMRKLAGRAMTSIAALSALYLAAAWALGGATPLWVFMACLVPIFFCVGILFGNLNAIAMKPLGHIAGTAAAVVGAASSFLAVPPAVLIGRCYNGTPIPLFTGFAVLSLMAVLLMRWANRG